MDCFDECLNHSFFEKNVISDERLEKVKIIHYKFSDQTKSVKIFYAPKIYDDSNELELIKIGNLQLTGSYCCPDFVIEITKSSSKTYYILDAKYSTYSAIKANHLFSCVKKYILDIGVKNHQYQKPNLLAILHPDSSDQELEYVTIASYFPQITTIISKPNKQSKLKSLITSICNEV